MATIDGKLRILSGKENGQNIYKILHPQTNSAQVTDFNSAVTSIVNSSAAASATNDSAGNTISSYYLPRIETNTYTLPTTGWTRDENETTEYILYYDIPIQGVTSDDVVMIFINKDSLNGADECNLCPMNESMTNAVRVRSTYNPKVTITVQYFVMKGAAS